MLAQEGLVKYKWFAYTFYTRNQKQLQLNPYYTVPPLKDQLRYKFVKSEDKSHSGTVIICILFNGHV